MGQKAMEIEEWLDTALAAAKERGKDPTGREEETGDS